MPCNADALVSGTRTLVLVVMGSAAMGTNLGLTPALLRAQPKAAKPTKATKPAKELSLRTRLADFKAWGVAPNTLELSGVSMLGRPMPTPQVIAMHLVVTAPDGTTVADEELDRSTIPPGRGNSSKPFIQRVWVTAGTYEVKVYSHFPGRIRFDEHGQPGPRTDAESTRNNVVVNEPISGACRIRSGR